MELSELISVVARAASESFDSMAYVQIDDVRLAYDDVGSGPELLLVHGYPFNRSLWAEQVDALEQDFSCDYSRPAGFR